MPVWPAGWTPITMPNSRYLANCEREQLHLSGAAQAHGLLLVMDASGRICHVSDNALDFLGQPTEALLGKPLPAALTPLQILLDGLGPMAGLRCPWRAGLESPLEGKPPLDCVLHRGLEGQTLIELTPASDFSPPRPHRMQEPYRNDAAYRAARQSLVEDMAKLTGFQRVMYYLFLENGDGLVVAEARDSQAYGTFLDHRFPASDIPQIARALYVKQSWRLIPDARQDPVPLRGLDPAPPDLSWADLRSVSPVHRVYLGNMGVRASLSFPVVMNGELAALVACHHTDPRQPSLSTLEVAAQQVQAHALAVGAYRGQERIRFMDGLDQRFEPARTLLQRHGALVPAWSELAPWLLDTFAADGVSLHLGETRLDHGLALEQGPFSSLKSWQLNAPLEPVFAADSLSRAVPGTPPSQCAGVLVIRNKSPQGAEFCVVFTRKEQIEEVLWGGNPDKPTEYHDGVLGIAPRRSFERWVEKRLGYCRPWTNEFRVMAFRLREILGSCPLA